MQEQGLSHADAGMPPGSPTVRRVGLVLGILAFLIVALTSPPGSLADSVGTRLGADPADAIVHQIAGSAWMTLGLLLVMLVWWVSEAVPLPVTALLPAILLPLGQVTGYRDDAAVAFRSAEAVAGYAHPVIFLFLGGFFLAAGMRKTGCDRRITFSLLSLPGVVRGPGRLIAAMMFVTALLSMLISNTATTAMMIPVALGILAVLDETPGRSRLGTALLLAIAWSASLGGIGTLIGSPPNLIAVGILADQGVGQIDFIGWLRLGLPVAVGGLVIAWILLMLTFRPRWDDAAGIPPLMRARRRELGPINRTEIWVLIVIAAALAAWMTQRLWPVMLPAAIAGRLAWIGVNEIGLTAGLLLFIVPVPGAGGPVLTWRDARYVDWGTLLLFGGGLTLSRAMQDTGLTAWLAGGLLDRMGGMPALLCLAVIVLMVDFLTEIASNTAVTTMMTPLLIVLAPQLGLDPQFVCIVAAMAASMAFMLPVATPPNALVFATGHLRIGQMVRAGFWMNLLGCTVLLGIVKLLS